MEGLAELVSMQHTELPRLLAVERIYKRSYTAVDQLSRQDSHGTSETGGDVIESCGEMYSQRAFQHPLSQSNHETSETGGDYGAAVGDLGGKHTEAGYDATSYSSYSASRCEYLEPARHDVPRFTHVPILWSKAYGGAHASMIGVQSAHNIGPKAWTHTGVADLDQVPSAFARSGPRSANTHQMGLLEQGSDERNREDGHSQSRGSLSSSALAGPPRSVGHHVSGGGGVSQRVRKRPIDRNPSQVTSQPISTAGSEIEKPVSGPIDEATCSLRRPLKFAGGFGGPFIRTDRTT